MHVFHKKLNVNGFDVSTLPRHLYRIPIHCTPTVSQETELRTEIFDTVEPFAGDGVLEVHEVEEHSILDGEDVTVQTIRFKESEKPHGRLKS